MFLMGALSVVLVGGICVLAYRLAVYALPLAVALWIVRLAFGTGAGWVGSGLVGLFTGAASYYVLAILFGSVRSLPLRLAVALIFAVPAAIAGYALVHGVMAESVPSSIWLTIFAVIGGAATGFSALARLTSPPLDSE